MVVAVTPAVLACLGSVMTLTPSLHSSPVGACGIGDARVAQRLRDSDLSSRYLYGSRSA